MKFFTANSFTPILNTKKFSSVFGGDDGASIPLNEKGFVEAMESIALPGTKFQGKETDEPFILEVTTKEYPYKGPFYVDSRLLTPSEKEREVILPNKEKILCTLKTLLGYPYFWGGNCLGTKNLLSLYSPPKKPKNLDNWKLKGFDCSGLIYNATSGYTPRNTSSWLSFGKEIEIEGKNINEVISSLKPLDAIVWDGHILFVFDQNQTIESKAGQGVVLKDIKKRLTSILEEGRAPKNTPSKEGYFLVRRWI